MLETQLLSLDLFMTTAFRGLLTLAKHVIEALLQLRLLVFHHVDLRVLLIKLHFDGC